MTLFLLHLVWRACGAIVYDVFRALSFFFFVFCLPSLRLLRSVSVLFLVSVPLQVVGDFFPLGRTWSVSIVY